MGATQLSEVSFAPRRTLLCAGLRCCIPPFSAALHPARPPIHGNTHRITDLAADPVDRDHRQARQPAAAALLLAPARPDRHPTPTPTPAPPPQVAVRRPHLARLFRGERTSRGQDGRLLPWSTVHDGRLRRLRLPDQHSRQIRSHPRHGRCGRKRRRCQDHLPSDPQHLHRISVQPVQPVRDRKL